MPRATIDRSETFRFELKSLPEGFVELRKLSYHEMTHRQDISGKVIYEQRQRVKKGQKRNDPELMRSMLEAAQTAVIEFEFKNCIVNHNLEDGNGILLDFTNPLSLRNLDPKIGAEIASYIDDLNQPDEDGTEDFTDAATSSSQDGMTKPGTDMERQSIERAFAGSGTEG